MSGFRFRLQSVLDLREQEEKAVAARLAEAESVADEARTAQRALEAVHQRGAQALRRAHQNGPTVGHLNSIGYVIDQLSQQISHAQSRVDSAEQVVEQTRNDLTAALQARRVLSRLRDRHFETWRAEGNAQDLRAMDELALSRFTRRTAQHSATSDDDAGGETNNDSGAATA